MGRIIPSTYPDQPYPGLRAFKRTEDLIFFGRDEHTTQLLSKLAATKFVAVLGSSGSGKSSLVRAGVLPALARGALAPAGASWDIAEFRPGQHPIKRLASALGAQTIWGQNYLNREGATVSDLVENLERGSMALNWLLGVRPLKDGTRLLVLVDQFEELFRFRQGSSLTEARSFVSQLLAAAEHPHVFVIITMRSDFLGECTRLPGLTEMVNAGIYQTPPLNPKQLAEAIELPARLFGSEVEPKLIRQLLKEAVDQQDLLPLLQHALLELWEKQTDNKKIIVLEDYNQLGSLEGILGAHAEQVWTELNNEGQRIGEVLFRALTMRGEDGRYVRHPYALANIATISNVENSQLISVVEQFRAPRRNFLMPPPEQPLDADTILDISHEALIRCWERLNDWVVNEADQAAYLQRLLNRAKAWKQKKGSPLTSMDLKLANEWWVKHKPEPSWSRRYNVTGEDLSSLAQYIDASIQQVDILERLSDSAKRWREGSGALWIDPDLTIAVDWWKEQKPTREWAQQLGFDLDQVKPFLDESKVAHQKELAKIDTERQRKVRRTRNIAIATFIGLLITTVLAGYALQQRGVAEEKRLAMELAKRRADMERDRAKDAEAEARKAREEERQRSETTQRLYNEALDNEKQLLAENQRLRDEIGSINDKAQRVIDQTNNIVQSETDKQREIEDLQTQLEVVTTSANETKTSISGVPEPQMVPIPAGRFTMGSAQGDPLGRGDEMPQHEVIISQAFLIGKFEVTFDEYEPFALATGAQLPNDFGWGRGRRPVVNVSWQDVTAYAEWLSEQTGKSYRLPTEAEWEYATRARTTTPWSFGKNDGDLVWYGWYIGDQMGQTQPVGDKRPNPWGLHDVHGNVWEWVQDCWDENYESASGNGLAWLGEPGGDCALRVFRGGSWNDIPENQRSASRNRSYPDTGTNYIGFRLAQDIEE